ncbi:MAG TPA: MFS transporter [Gaiellaceae bacterium]|nr:MFS transporter [Gaiellaceae bacterium]
MGKSLGEAARPLRQRRFRLLWLGRVSSAIGDAIVPVALTFAVLSIHGSATALGGVLASFTTARVVFTLAGGVVADRFSRRTIMLSCDLLRAGIQAFIAVMLLTHQMTLVLFIACEAVYGMASAFFGPAADGLVPQTIEPEELQSANALLGISRNTLNVFGPAASGLLLWVASPGYVFAIDAASFVASAAFLARLDVDAPIRAPLRSFGSELREGFREVTSRSWVRAPIIGFAISNFMLASFLVLGPLVFITHFGNPTKDWGLVSACGSVGAIVGAFASVKLAPRHPLYGAFVSTTLLAIPIAALAEPLAWEAIAVAWGFGMGSVALGNTWWETTLQRLIPEHVYSRVRSYDILVSFVFMPVGMIAFGPLADWIGLEHTLLVAAALVAVTNLAVAFTPSVRTVTSAAATPAATMAA